MQPIRIPSGMLTPDVEPRTRRPMASHTTGDGGIPPRDAAERGLTPIVALGGIYGVPRRPEFRCAAQQLSLFGEDSMERRLATVRAADVVGCSSPVEGADGLGHVDDETDQRRFGVAGIGGDEFQILKPR